MDIGKKIKELMSPRGSPEELADRSELSKGFIFSWNGISLPVHCDIDGHFAGAWAQPSQNFFRKSRKIRLYFKMKTILRKLILNLAARLNGLYRTLRKKYDGNRSV